MRTRTMLVVLALLAATAAVADGQWFGEFGWSAIKTTDSLESIATGPSISVYQWEPGHAVWLDLALLYDGEANACGGFGGLSTEIEGQPILESLTAPIRLISKDLLSNVGSGVKCTYGDWSALLYVTTRF